MSSEGTGSNISYPKLVRSVADSEIPRGASSSSTAPCSSERPRSRPPQGGSASFATLATSVFHGSISAVYSGDSNFNGSTWLPPASVTQPAPVSAVRITMSPSGPTIGAPVTLTVFVETNLAAPPAGSVQFADETRVLATVPVFSGQANIAVTLGAGPHNITASYGGDALYPASSVTYGVLVTKLAGSLQLTSNLAAATYGQPVTLTARWSAQPAGAIPNPAGEVQFFSGCLCGLFGAMVDRTLIGTAALTGGVATLAAAGLPVGTSQILAVFGGDDNWSASTSNAVTESIAKAATHTLWTSASRDSVGARLSASVHADPTGSGVSGARYSSWIPPTMRFWRVRRFPTAWPRLRYRLRPRRISSRPCIPGTPVMLPASQVC